ncbi:drug/metabolite transporter (DMT)-like permease [Stackebrandtia endophytica]|uniref:Drug/metabolite transporter (DMT)-like permease n=1 Tax=Stackebrandtia endophytica TaxID=1496996 RepID=A0A543B3J2_9ACTN|nr:DMT family transporter [Stackebrandtia endophytica]TQL79411.1 drug/metabolite transporter (DMT)-like permease [Stackebrandtia endophytica]
MTTAPRALPWVAALLTMAFWASSFVVIRGAADHYSPGPMALLRCLAAAGVISAWMLVRRPVLPKTTKTWLIVMMWGVAWFAVYTVALNAAEQSIDAGTAAMVVNIAPLIIAVVAGLFLGEGLPTRLILGILVALVGVGMITAAGFTGVFTISGLVLSLVAALLYAACVLLQKRHLSRGDSVTVTWLGILVGTVACLVFTPDLATEVVQAPLDITLQVVYLGVVPTAIAFNLWGYALRHLPAGVLGSSSLLVPAIVVVLAWMFLGEVPTPLAAAGGLLCLAGAGFAVVPQMLGVTPVSASPADQPPARRIPTTEGSEHPAHDEPPGPHLAGENVVATPGRTA